MLASLSFAIFQNVSIAAVGFSKTLASLSIAAFQNISIAAFFQSWINDSLQDTVQRAGSVHLAERLCSFSPLNP
jgi:hypothetical protein